VRLGAAEAPARRVAGVLAGRRWQPERFVFSIPSGASPARRRGGLGKPPPREPLSEERPPSTPVSVGEGLTTMPRALCAGRNTVADPKPTIDSRQPDGGGTSAVREAMTMKDWFLADLNLLSPADHNATLWVATPDGSWTRMVGAGVNPDIPPIAAGPRPGRPLSSQVQGEDDAGSQVPRR
jgi:hypothetical protein